MTEEEIALSRSTPGFQMAKHSTTSMAGSGQARTEAACADVSSQAGASTEEDLAWSHTVLRDRTTEFLILTRRSKSA
jgi:hypothetical protein